MAVERSTGAVRFAFWIEVQNYARDLTPIGAISISVEKAHVGDSVFEVIQRQDRTRRRGISNVWI
jgi:hypothetical protein